MAYRRHASIMVIILAVLTAAVSIGGTSAAWSDRLVVSNRAGAGTWGDDAAGLWICHRTRSASNPYRLVFISPAGLNGHQHHDHPLDLIPAPAGASTDGDCVAAGDLAGAATEESTQRAPDSSAPVDQAVAAPGGSAAPPSAGVQPTTAPVATQLATPVPSVEPAPLPAGDSTPEPTPDPTPAPTPTSGPGESARP